MNRYHPQDKYMILNQSILNEQCGGVTGQAVRHQSINEQGIPGATVGYGWPAGWGPDPRGPGDGADDGLEIGYRTKEDLLQTPQGREILDMYPDSNPDGIDINADQSLGEWWDSLSIEARMALMGLIGAGAFAGLALSYMPKRILSFLRFMYSSVLFNPLLMAGNDINAMIARTFEIDGILPDMDDTYGDADSWYITRFLSWFLDDDFDGNDYGLLPGQTFSESDIAAFMSLLGPNVELQDGTGSMDLEIGQIHVIAEMIMDSFYAAGGAAAIVYLAGLLSAGIAGTFSIASVFAAGSVTIAGITVTGTIAGAFAMAMVIAGWAANEFANQVPGGVQQTVADYIGQFLEGMGLNGFDEAYDQYQEDNPDYYDNDEGDGEDEGRSGMLNPGRPGLNGRPRPVGRVPKTKPRGSEQQFPNIKPNGLYGRGM